VGPIITWWNAKNLWDSRPLPVQTLRRLPDNRYYDVMAGEDERGGGALLYFGLREPLEITRAEREFPSSLLFAELAKKEHAGVWIDVEKPFWRDVPLWLASGLVDSIGVAHNHLWRRGGLHNEAWGRPRDETRYPGPHGNGLWTQDIYYHALNCGLRVPPSAGSASGVLPNPVGHNRCYVHVADALTDEKWWAGLRAGRNFVTNGPLLLVRAENELPGHVFTSSTGSLSLQIKGRVVSREPIARVEVIRDSEIVKTLNPSTIPSAADQGKGLRSDSELTIDTRIECHESGWFLVRAIADVDDSFRFASTAPFYVEIGERKKIVRRASAEFFLQWAEERREELAAALEPPQRDAVLTFHNRAVQYWAAAVHDSQ
jgi:hypothetical protein